MGQYYASKTTASIPDRLVVMIPAGSVVLQIDHSADGNAGVLHTEVGVTSAVSESSNLSLTKVAFPQGGGHQHWNGHWQLAQDTYFKAWLRSVSAGGSHNIVIWTE